MTYAYHFCIYTCALVSGVIPVYSQQGGKVPVKDSLAWSWDQSIPGSFTVQSTVRFDSTKIAAFFKSHPLFGMYEHGLREFYRRRDYAYAWFDKGSLTEQAGNLANRVLNLQNEGIYKQAPYQPELDSLIHDSNVKPVFKRSDTLLELMLTAQYFAFSSFAWEGMNAAVSKQCKWFLPRKKVSYDQYLDSLINFSGAKGSFSAPVYRQYNLLRSWLKKYRVLEKELWLPIVLTKTPLKPGDSSGIISKIKRRLYYLEDFRADTSSNLFDAELLRAIKLFQERHGIVADGLLSKGTIDVLNLPVITRIRQIVVNMERSRWLPVGLKSDFLAVNIPEYKLHVYHADSLLWSCNVVVGKTVHPTTVFYGEIKYVVFRPYWNIPPGILKNEVLPGMRKSSKYLRSHNMEITGRANGLPVVRQKPGADNALGLVKFLFPNSYNIYLHDTPVKSLFNESSRAFSHGCIRIEEPAKLAAFLLKEEPAWNSESIRTAMHAGKERYITLNEKVPVFITYLTAFVDRTGKLNFRNDIYNLDERLASVIFSGNGEY